MLPFVFQHALYHNIYKRRDKHNQTQNNYAKVTKVKATDYQKYMKKFINITQRCRVIPHQVIRLLTPWRLGGLAIFAKNSSFWLPYQRPSSSADCARELFNGSKESASLVDCTQKTFLTGGAGFL